VEKKKQEIPIKRIRRKRRDEIVSPGRLEKKKKRT
jgi:hypothetical protein